MKRRSKICGIIVLLLLLFTLSGCRDSKSTVEEVMEDIKTTEAGNPEDTTLELNDVILQVEDTSVTYGEVLFYIYQAKQRYEEKFNEDVWDVFLKDGTSFEAFAKEEILRELTEVKVICEEAKRQEVNLTDSERAEAENNAVKFLNSVSQEERETYRFDEEVLKGIYIDNAIADKMFQKVKAAADVQVDEESYRQVTVQYIEVMTKGTDKAGNVVDMTDKEKEKAKKRANTLLEKSKLIDDFESYAKKKSSVSEVTLTFGKEDMPKDIGEVSMQLKTGEFSDVIEGDSGYYIIYCVTDKEDSTFTKIEEAKEKIRNAAFESQYTNWSEQLKIEVSVNLWKLIQIKNL